MSNNAEDDKQSRLTGRTLATLGSILRSDTLAGLERLVILLAALLAAFPVYQFYSEAEDRALERQSRIVAAFQTCEEHGFTDLVLPYSDWTTTLLRARSLTREDGSPVYFPKSRHHSPHEAAQLLFVSFRRYDEGTIIDYADTKERAITRSVLNIDPRAPSKSDGHHFIEELSVYLSHEYSNGIRILWDTCMNLGRRSG